MVGKEQEQDGWHTLGLGQLQFAHFSSGIFTIRVISTNQSRLFSYTTGMSGIDGFRHHEDTHMAHTPVSSSANLRRTY